MFQNLFYFESIAFVMQPKPLLWFILLWQPIKKPDFVSNLASLPKEKSCICYLFNVNSCHQFCRNRSAENLYGYSAAEALGKDVLELLVDPQDFGVAMDIIHRVQMGENWTGQFPIKDKMGRRFLIIATDTPLYDDNGSLIGIICVSSDPRPFQEIKVTHLEAKELEAGQSFNRSRSGVASKLGLDPEQPLQTAIASKLTNLVST